MKITHTQVYVLDQDEALDFYVGKLGFELGTDADLGFMRWLTVTPPGDPNHQILLERPGPPAHDDATAEVIRNLVTKGAVGWVGFSTTDCRATFEALKARGVEFSEAPEERPYGIDSGFRDPSGNSFRLTQVKDLASI